MKIGFTGTQQGMTLWQATILRKLLEDESYSFNPRFFMEPDNEFHHGDCIGADNQAANTAYEMGYIVVSHPPIDTSKRAYATYNIEMPAKPYLERNHDIVDEVDLMIATPKEIKEQLRSGTWATIRYAKKKKKRLVIIYPSGQAVTINYE